MADPKNVIIEIKNGLADVRQQMNLLKQDTSSWVSSLSSGVSRLSKSSGGGGGGGGGGSSTLVAPNPKFTPPATQGGGENTMVPYQPMGGNIVANTPPVGGGGGGNGGGGGGGGNGNYTGNTNLSQYVTENPTAGVLYAAALTSGLLDKPGESVEAQLLMSRTGYFTGKGYDKTNALQAQLAKQGTVNSKLDVMRGLSAAQNAGITGPNVVAANGQMSSVAGGVASASNLVPGMGFEGTMRAYASMQQGRNVNMLRGIGIQLRDDQGNMKPPDQIIDDIWKKICRDYGQAYGSGKKPSKQEVQIGLQPGNSMDSMLDMYFGNDPMAKQLVANGLLYKAETGGSAISKETLTKLGATTEATNAFSNRNAAGAKQTGKTAKAGAEGYSQAANQLASISTSLTDNFLPALEKATNLNAYFLTMLGAANDIGEKGLAAIAASGGPVAAAATAILVGAGLGVGKFVFPGSTGQSSGGAASVSTGEGTPDEFAKGLLDKLGAEHTQANIDAIKIWAKKEGGGVWGAKGGAYNPLNTTLKMDGASNFNPAGVKNYQSMEQGIEATYQTLTGNASESRGYDKIVSLMRSGASREQIISAISTSSWAGAGGYKDGLAGITPNFKMPSNTTNNNTNVTINVTGTNRDPNAIAQEIQRIIEQQAIKNKAVNK
jgi:hypothetical protein